MSDHDDGHCARQGIHQEEGSRASGQDSPRLGFGWVARPDQHLGPGDARRAAGAGFTADTVVLLPLVPVIELAWAEAASRRPRASAAGIAGEEARCPRMATPPTASSVNWMETRPALEVLRMRAGRWCGNIVGCACHAGSDGGPVGQPRADCFSIGRLVQSSHSGRLVGRAQAADADCRRPQDTEQIVHFPRHLARSIVSRASGHCGRSPHRSRHHPPVLSPRRCPRRGRHGRGLPRPRHRTQSSGGDQDSSPARDGRRVGRGAGFNRGAGSLILVIRTSSPFAASVRSTDVSSSSPNSSTAEHYMVVDLRAADVATGPGTAGGRRRRTGDGA